MFESQSPNKYTLFENDDISHKEYIRVRNRIGSGVRINKCVLHVTSISNWIWSGVRSNRCRGRTDKMVRCRCWTGTLKNPTLFFIPVGTNCAPYFAEIFLYSYEAEFIQSLLSTGQKLLASRFNLTYRYIDDVLCINNPEFENYVGQRYPSELEIKDTSESITSASYLDLLLSIWRDGQLHTSIYGKRDEFNYRITNFPLFHLRRRMALLYLGLKSTPGLVPRINVLFSWPGDFPVIK